MQHETHPGWGLSGQPLGSLLTGQSVDVMDKEGPWPPLSQVSSPICSCPGSCLGSYPRPEG